MQMAHISLSTSITLASRIMQERCNKNAILQQIDEFTGHLCRRLATFLKAGFLHRHGPGTQVDSTELRILMNTPCIKL